MPYCSRCDRFFHSLKNYPTKKNQGTVSTIQGQVAALSPTHRVLGKVIQDGTAKGDITVLPDSGSVAEVMPVALASSLNLAWQEVNPEKYLLSSANGSPINIVLKTVFT